MDQLNTALNANLNVLVVFSLLFLSMALLVLLGVILSLVPQANRTMGAFERLADTVSTELQPTLSEASKLLGGVLKLQDLAQNSVSNVSDKVEDVTDNLSRAAHGAKRGGRIVGAGVLAGLRAYLSEKDEHTER
jgi:uncharacterized protein YoxC